MTESQPILVKKSSTFLVSTILLVLALLPLLYFILIDPPGSLKEPYLQFNSTLITLPCIFYPLLVGMWLISYFYDQVNIFEDRVEYKQRLRPKEIYYFKDLIGWDTGRDKDGKTDSCYLYFKDKTVSVVYMDNVKEFEDYFTQRKFPHHTGPKPLPIGSILIGIICIGLMFGFLDIFNYAPEIRESHKETLRHQLVGMVLRDKPEEYRVGRHSNNDFGMSARVKGIDGFTFYLRNNTSLPGYRNEINWNTPAGDTVSIEILQYDYDVKIAHTRPPTFWDKHFDWNEIHACRIKGKRFDVINEY